MMVQAYHSHVIGLICTHGALYIHVHLQMYTWDRFSKKGPNAYIIKFPVRAIEM